jgi:hypothetical protein
MCGCHRWGFPRVAQNSKGISKRNDRTGEKKYKNKTENNNCKGN